MSLFAIYPTASCGAKTCRMLVAGLAENLLQDIAEGFIRIDQQNALYSLPKTRAPQSNNPFPHSPPLTTQIQTF